MTGAPPAEDWSDAGGRVLHLDALSTVPLSRAETVTRPAALGGADLPVELPPFDPPEKVLWVLRRSLTVALGPDGVAGVLAALPGLGSGGDFALGVVAGVGDAVQDVVREHLDLVRSGLGAVVDFYSMAFDTNLWMELLKVWTAPVGSGLQGVLDELKAEHPGVASALSSYAPLARGFDRLVAPMLDDSAAPGMPWSAATAAVATWMAQIPEALGVMVRPLVDKLVADRGNSRAQGRTVGHVVGRLVVEAVMIALDLYGLVRGAAGVARGVLVSARRALPSVEVAKVAAQMEKAAPGVAAAGKGVAGAVTEALQIYERLATEVDEYRRLNRLTMAFNKEVRDIAGLALSDTGYMAMRLDAQHIVERVWYKRFAKDFEKAFGWKSAEEMDAIALHTEWHIRSGEKLATNLNLVGAENEASLTKRLQGFLAAKQVGPNGVAQPFTSLNQLFAAHADFYRTYAPRLWPRLEEWFTTRTAKLAVLSPP